MASELDAVMQAVSLRHVTVWLVQLVQDLLCGTDLHRWGQMGTDLQSIYQVCLPFGGSMYACLCAVAFTNVWDISMMQLCNHIVLTHTNLR